MPVYGIVAGFRLWYRGGVNPVYAIVLLFRHCRVPCLLSAVFGALLAPCLGADSGTLEFFERRIQPVQAQKCRDCHAADAERLRADSQLDHREHLLAGGETGPSIMPGDPESSSLVESIPYGKPGSQMPPRERLSPEIAQDFATSAGAAEDYSFPARVLVNRLWLHFFGTGREFEEWLRS